MQASDQKGTARLQWATKPRRAINPRDIDFQTAELVIPNPARDQRTITSYATNTSDISVDRNQMNRIIWGDNILAMQALLSSGLEGTIKLIYIDPPFWTNENYYADIEVGEAEITKSPSVIERLAYKDIWEGGIDSFLDMLYPRIQLIRRLLAEDGSLFLHLDYHVGHYAKIILDEIFGVENFRNEIVVKRGRKKGLMYQFKQVDRMHASTDIILWYTKSPQTKFKHPLSETTGSESKWMGYWSNVDRPTMRYELFGNDIPARGQWKWEKERAKRAIQNYKDFEVWLLSNMKEISDGTLSEREKDILRDKYLEEYWLSNGQTLEFIRKRTGVKYAEYWVRPREHALIDSLWTDIEAYDYSSEYPTEKHVELLRRIITNFSAQGDLVADFFVGSGTSLVVADSLQRRWIGCDFSKVAIQIARRRLVQKDSRPFMIENIGNYQRQLIYLSRSRIYEIQPIILKLYGATPRKDYRELGVRQAEGKLELVYVSYPDRPVNAKKVEDLESLAERLDGTGYGTLIILGWDYEYNYDELLHRRERSTKRKWHTQIISKTIPPDVYDYLKKAKNLEDLDSLAGKVVFYERPYLQLKKPEIKKKNGTAEVTIAIDKYVIFDFPIQDEQEKKTFLEIMQKNPLALIDYWSIDWDYDGSTFKSEWQAMRRMGRKSMQIPVAISKEIDSGKLYDVAIRIVDIFGNDAAKTVTVDLR